MSEQIWRCGDYVIHLAQPHIMGIVNVTADSFSDGGQYDEVGNAIAHCEQLIADGADLLDIGAESSRPGAQPVPLEVELEKLKAIVPEAAKLGVPISVDTYKPQVMQRALDWGASVINDIWGFRQPGALEAVAPSDCGLVIMHMHREPQTMQLQPMQRDPLAEVHAFLTKRCEAARQLGIEATRLCVDTGFGFGKTVAQNFQLLAQFPQKWDSEIAVLMGCSRKSSLGDITGLSVEDRLIPSVAAAVLSIDCGAHIVRVHDVKETRDALTVWQTIQKAKQQQVKRGSA